MPKWARALRPRTWRLHRIAATPVIAVALVVLSSAACAAPVDAAQPGHPVSAPYVDVTGTHPDLVGAAAATGVTELRLAFALATDGGCRPSWGGVRPLTDPALVAQTDELHRRGVTLAVASGGADGPYLERACASAAELAAAYATALDSVGAQRLDVDVETDVDADRVIDALALLQAGRDVAITLTLRVLNQHAGLEPEAVELVQAAADAGLEPTVNAMVMNFPPVNGWAEAMVEAAEATTRQLAVAYPQWSEAQRYAHLELTVMIGRNDLGMVTTIDDAGTVLAYARDRRITRIGHWSLGRDNGGCPGRVAVSPDCSGVVQDPFEFTKLMTARGGYR